MLEKWIELCDLKRILYFPITLQNMSHNQLRLTIMTPWVLYSEKKEPHSPRDREMIGNHNPLNLSLQNMLLLQLICFVMCRCIENIPLFKKKKKVAFYLVHDRLSKFKLEKLFLLSFWLHLSLQLSGIKRKLMVMGHQDLNAWWQIDGEKVQFEW